MYPNSLVYSLRVIKLKSLCAILWQHYKASQVSKSTSRDSIKKVWMTSKTLKQIKCIMKKLDITIVCPWLCNLCSLFALTKEQNNVFVCLFVSFSMRPSLLHQKWRHAGMTCNFVFVLFSKKTICAFCMLLPQIFIISYLTANNKQKTIHCYRLIILYYSKNKFFYFKWKYRENYNLLKN